MTNGQDEALRLWVVMNRALRTIEDRLSQQVEAHGLSMTEFAVLEVLLHKGPLPIGEIGQRILRTSGSMTYVLDKLQKRHLIRRRPSAEDRRVLRAELTEAGRALIEEVFPEHAALVATLMQGLTPAEQRETADVLRRLGLSARDRAAAAHEH